MKFVLLLLIIGGGIFCFAPPLRSQVPGDVSTSADSTTARSGRKANNQTRPLTTVDPAEDALARELAGIDRPQSEMRKEMKEKLRISDGEKITYKKTLGDSKVNLVRLVAAYSCNTSEVVDLSDPRCSEDPDFFQGSYYSFRYKDYGENSWTDLDLVETEFTAGNKFRTVGAIIDLGADADLGKVDENSKEVQSFWNLPAAETLEEKSEQKTRLEKGFSYDDLFIGSKVKFEPHHTYLLRTISYRLEGGFAMFRSSFNWYNTDSLFVFKVIDFDGQRTVTLAWKKLMQRIAPMLKDKNQ